MFNLLEEGVSFYFDMTSNLEVARMVHGRFTSSLLSVPLVCVSAFPPPSPHSNISG